MSMRDDDEVEEAFNRGLMMGFVISYVTLIVVLGVVHYVF